MIHCADICHMGFDNADDSANEELGIETAECIGVGIGAIYYAGEVPQQPRTVLQPGEGISQGLQEIVWMKRGGLRSGFGGLGAAGRNSHRIYNFVVFDPAQCDIRGIM